MPNYAELLKRQTSLQSQLPQWIKDGNLVKHSDHGAGLITSVLGSTVVVEYADGTRTHQWVQEVQQGKLMSAPKILDQAALEQIPARYIPVLKAWEAHIRHLHIDPPQAGNLVPIPHDLPIAIQEGLNALGIQQLYSHQMEMLMAYRDGKDIGICTNTASGKTYAFAIPILERVILEGHTALVICPTNALIDDQTQKLKDLANHISAYFPSGGRPLQVERITGDVPWDERNRIFRTIPDILIVNPDVLNFLIGKYFNGFQGFVRRLGTIVVDEAQTGMGVMGNHIANLIRRVRLKVRKMGGDYQNLQYVAASATVGNPSEMMRLLFQLSESPTILQTSGKPDPGRVTVCLRPKVGSITRVCQLLAQLLHEDLSSIVFFNNRGEPKTIKQQVGKYSAQGNRIAIYNSSIPKDKKLNVIEGIKTGAIKMVLSTSALEAGVDIPELEASIVWGLPGIGSTHQRWGRAGRGDVPGLAIFIPAMHRTLDFYYGWHPQKLVHGTPEAVLLEPDYIVHLRQHIRAAIAELRPTIQEIQSFFGKNANRVLESLIQDGGVQVLGNQLSILKTDEARGPIREINIRGSQFNVVQLVYEGTVIEQLNYSHAIREVFPGAIYATQGEGEGLTKYRVTSLDLEGKTAHLEGCHNPNCITHAKGEMTVSSELIESRAIAIQSPTLSGTLMLEFSWGTITSEIKGYEEVMVSAEMKCFNSTCVYHKGGLVTEHKTCPSCGSGLRTEKMSQKIVGEVNFNSPYSEEYQAPILRLVPNHNLIQSIKSYIKATKTRIEQRHPTQIPTEHEPLFSHSAIPLMLHTLSHQIILALPMKVNHNSSTLNDLVHGNSCTLFETADGGVGAAEYLFNYFEEMCRTALELINSCDCRHGCPRCLHFRHCTIDNEHLYRNVGQALLETISGNANNDLSR
jgi:DEAD/DEAH box helicase domain-containing protein